MFSQWVGDCVGKQDVHTQLRRFRMWWKRNGESFALMCLGVFMTLAVLIALYELFTSAPIITEEAELVTRVTQRTMQHRCEWVPPQSWSTQMHLAAMSNSMHVSMYKLKVIVIVDATRLFEMKRVLNSLTGAVYNNRQHSIDLEVVVLNAHKPVNKATTTTVTINTSGNANIAAAAPSAPYDASKQSHSQFNKETNQQAKSYAMPQYEHILDHVHWPHGRFEVVLRDEQSASQLPFSTLWYPTSLWQLVMFLDDSYTISPMWYFYVSKMLSQYIADKGQYRKYIQLNQRTAMSDLLTSHQSENDVQYDTDKVGDAHTKKNMKSNQDNKNNDNIDIIGFSLIGASSLHKAHQTEQHTSWNSNSNQNSSPYSVTSSSHYAPSPSHSHFYYKQANHDSKHNQWQHNQQQVQQYQINLFQQQQWMSLFPQSTGMATVYLPYFWRRWLHYVQRQSMKSHMTPRSQQQQQLQYTYLPQQSTNAEKDSLTSIQSVQRSYDHISTSHQSLYSSQQEHNLQKVFAVKNDMQWQQMNEYILANDLYVLYPSLSDNTQFAKMHSTQCNINKEVAVANAVINESDDGLVNSYQFLTTHLPLKNVPRYDIGN